MYESSLSTVEDNLIHMKSLYENLKPKTRELIKVFTSLPPPYVFARTHHFGFFISGFLLRYSFGRQTESYVRYFDVISKCYT